MAAKKHHKSPIVTYLGPSAELPQADLPTVRDMLQQCQLLRERQMFCLSSLKSGIATKLIKRITSKWNTLFKLAFRKKVCPREKRTFTHKLDKLFNILTCDCEFVDYVSAKCNNQPCSSKHLNCCCPRESLIPKLDLAFIKD